jgi:predicted amidohydrolase YtcJ
MLPPGRWIRCTGYNEFRLEEGRHPSCRDLDRATVLHPVLLTHRSGHAHVLNTHALELAGITVESGEPEGGMIGRDPDTGEPNGILYGMGQYLSGTVPPHDERDLTAALSKAGRILLSLGITLVQDASPGNDQARWNQFIGWKRQGLFPPRVVMMFGAGQHESLQGRQPFFDKETGLGSGALKIMLDEVRGSLNPPQRELNALVLGLHRRGFQVAMHAVEEGTVEAALSALEHAHRHDANRHNRHRLEHCSICTPRTAQRIAQLGATVVTNPAFIYYSGDRYLATVPRSQMQHLYALKTMLGAGIPAAAGSDAPVAPPDPLKGIYAAVTRHSDTGRSVLPSQAIKVEQAIRLFSCEAAWSCFREKQLGTIARGKLADLAVLNANPLQAPAGELKHIKVEMTVLNGQVVYSESL